jgi:hypothetical protein
MKKIIFLLANVCFCNLIFGQWTTDTLQNTMVRDSSSLDETANMMATAADGSSYISWFEPNTAAGGYELRMQRLDARGQQMWGSRGLLVSNKKQSSALFRYDLKTDANGNAIVGFQDVRALNGVSQVVVYKITPSGSFAWGNDGIMLHDTVTFAGSGGLSPTIGFTNAGNVIIAWNATPVGKPNYIAYQKIAPTGTLLWTQHQRIQDTLATGPKFDRPTPIASAGADDFIMLFVRRTGSGLGVSRMYAQRFDADGQKMWAAPKQVATRTIAFAFFPTVVSDGKGGMYIGFNSGNPSFPTRNDAYMQRIQADSTAWNPDGVQLTTQSNFIKNFSGLQVLSNRNEIWAQIQTLDPTQSRTGIAVQKLDTLGNRLLSDSAQTVFPLSLTTTESKIPYDMRVTTDGLVGVFEENSTFNKEKLYAYKVDFSGNLLWRKTLCALETGKGRVALGNFHQNQIVVSWQDLRLNATGGIYAQNINNQGTVGARTFVEDLNSISQMRLFPNPSAQPTLAFDLAQDALLTLSVFDLSGKLHFTKTQFFDKGSQSYTLPTEYSNHSGSINAGVFMIRLSSASGSKMLRWVKL